MNVKVINACIAEADRQGVGAEGALRLLKAYVKAHEWSRVRAEPGSWDLFDLHRIIEPGLGGRKRTTPVTFANGGTAVHHSLVRERYDELLAQLDGLDDEVREEWLKAFLDLHPFEDGNGRLTWLIRVWLYTQWDDPEPLPDYYGERA